MAFDILEKREFEVLDALVGKNYKMKHIPTLN